MQIITLDPKQMMGKKPSFDKASPNKVWIAGGAIRGWFTGQEKLSDVDYFFADEQVFNFCTADLIESGYELVNKHPNADTYIKNDLAPIQCIKKRTYTSVQELFDSFDFTLCQFAWDGEKIYSTVEAVISTQRNHLGVHKLQGNIPDSLRRAFKYNRKGFYPCNGTLLALSNAMRTLTEEDIKNSIEISPNGGKRIIRID